MHVQFQGLVVGYNYKGLINNIDGIYEGDSVCLVRSGRGVLYFHPENVKYFEM